MTDNTNYSTPCACTMDSDYIRDSETNSISPLFLGFLIPESIIVELILTMLNAILNPSWKYSVLMHTYCCLHFEGTQVTVNNEYISDNK